MGGIYVYSGRGQGCSAIHLNTPIIVYCLIGESFIYRNIVRNVPSTAKISTGREGERSSLGSLVFSRAFAQ